MAVHLITGYRGTEHIQSKDARSFNVAMFGSGEFVMEIGNQLEGSIINNNTVRLLDGDILMQGGHIRIETDTYEDLTITTGTAGKNRNDLIVMTYEKNSSDGTENAYLEVIKGTESDGTATDPEYTSGTLAEGALKNQMPLYRVKIEGVVLSEIEVLFTTIPTYKTLAEQYAAQFQAACSTYLGALNILDTMEEITANTQSNQLAGALSLKETIEFINTELAKKLSLEGGTLTGQLNTQHLCPVTAKKYNIGVKTLPFKYVYAFDHVAVDSTNGVEVGQLYCATDGTKAVTGECRFLLGNPTAKGTAGNSRGVIRVFGENTGYTEIKDDRNSTGNVEITLPKVSGRLVTDTESNMKTYTALSQLGLTSSNTFVDLINAIPDGGAFVGNSSLFSDKSEFPYADVNWCLFISKSNFKRMTIICNRWSTGETYFGTITSKDEDTSTVTTIGWRCVIPYEGTKTLVAGATSITFSSEFITTDSTVEVFTSTYGVNPTDVSVAAGSVTLTFDAQDADVSVKVRVS